MLPYLFLLIIVIAVPQLIRNGLKNITLKEKNLIITIVCFGSIFILSSLKKYTVGTDSMTYYLETYENISNQSWGQIFSAFTSEPLFYAVLKIFKSFNANYVILQFFFYSIISSSFGICAYRFCKRPEIFAICFLSFDLLNMSLSGVRQILGVAFILYGFILFIQFSKTKIFKWVIFFLFIIIATLFHKTSIIGIVLLPMSYLDFKKNQIIPFIFLIIIWVLVFPSIYNMFFLPYNIYYPIFNSDSIPFFAIFLLFFFIVIFCTHFLKERGNKFINFNFGREETVLSSYYVKSTETFKINLLSYSIPAILFFFTSPLSIVTSRFAYYFLPFLYIAISNFVFEWKKTKFGLLVKIFFFLLASIYFLYIFLVKDPLNETPYLFFWQ